MEETERSLHDAIMIVRRALKNDAVVAGGGAIEMELSKYLRDQSRYNFLVNCHFSIKILLLVLPLGLLIVNSNFRLVAGKEQLIIAAMAKALEIIPRQLCDNAGFDATNILNKLRQKHAQVRNLTRLFFPLSVGFVLVLTL